MNYVLEIGCVDRLSLVSPLGRVLREIAELGGGPVRAEFMERPNCRHRCSVELGVATRVTERVIIDIIDELTDDAAIISDKAHVVISAPDYVNKNIWMLDVESAVPWEETILDAIAAMEGVAFAIHASGDTIVSGDIDISATMQLPLTDYRYISGRIRPDRITKAHEP
jgi:fructose-specific component phosphotransferase system IIB-like protein